LEAGLALAREHQPRVIVVDDETGASAQHPLLAERNTSLIILGRAQRAERGNSVPGTQLVAKPYHYAPLIHKIEQLAKAA
jgi:hypothetical protein